MGFGNSNRSRTAATFAQFNAKEGLFVISHAEQAADGSRTVKTAKGSGRVSYEEKHSEFAGAFVRGILIMENKNFDDPSKIDKVIGVKVRDAQDGREYIMKFNMSAFASKVLGLINAADLSKPMDFVGGAFAVGTKKKDLKTGAETIRDKAEPFLIGVQNGEKLKAKWEDAADWKLPVTQYLDVKNGKGEVVKQVPDSSERNDWIVEYAGKLAKKVEEAAKTQEAPAAAAPAPAVAAAQPNPAEDHHTEDLGGDDHGLTTTDILGADEDAEAFRTVA